jgi:hypothetical protein
LTTETEDLGGGPVECGKSDEADGFPITAIPRDYRDYGDLSLASKMAKAIAQLLRGTRVRAR